MPWATKDFGTGRALDFINGADTIERMDLAVVSANELIGICGINQISPTNRSANLGYWIRSDRTGHGYGWQAARLTAVRAQAERAIHRFQVTMSVENQASRKTAERLGANFEGIARDALLLRGSFHDARIYSYFLDDQEPSDEPTYL